MDPILLILFGFGAFVAAVLLFAASSARKERQEAREDLADRICPSCGQPFSVETADRAEKAWSRRTADPGSHVLNNGFPAQSNWPVDCSECRWRGDFDPASRVLEAESTARAIDQSPEHDPSHVA